MTPELWRVRVTKPKGYKPPATYSHSLESSMRYLIRGYPMPEPVIVHFFSAQTAHNQAVMARKAGLHAVIIPCAVVELDPL